MSTLTASASGVVAVTPSDTEDIPRGPCRFLQVGSSGSIVIVVGNDVVTLPFVQAGQILPYYVSRVNATGTTVTGIVAGY